MGQQKEQQQSHTIRQKDAKHKTHQQYYQAADGTGCIFKSSAAPSAIFLNYFVQHARMFCRDSISQIRISRDLRTGNIQQPQTGQQHTRRVYTSIPEVTTI